MVVEDITVGHDFGGIEQFPDASRNWHGRQCICCGYVQYYGKKWGSNKCPGFAPITEPCYRDDQSVLEDTPTTSSASNLIESHDFGGIEQFPDASRNWHGRQCICCGYVQYYGKKWGSNKYPGFAPIIEPCQ